MPEASDAPSYLYTAAWFALLGISIFYVVVGAVLRRGTRRPIYVTRYEPPKGILPAVAAYLTQGGRSERSFATAIVSLAAKGYLTILQKADWVTLERLRDNDSQLPPEESVVLLSLFPPHTHTYLFNASDSSKLFETFKEFRSTVQDEATPELMSTHFVLWILGFTYSFIVIELVLLSMPRFASQLSVASTIFLIVVIFVGGSCFVAALRVWPSTLLKLGTFLPGSSRPRRPLNFNDAIPLFLTVTALVGFMFLAVLTTTNMAALAAAAVAINVFSRRLLNAPTSAGRAALAELREFREFLNRADADRMKIENAPGKSPLTLEPYTPYAVALGVEHGWGEEFAGNLLELLQADQAYSTPGIIPEVDTRPIVLRLFDRKK